MTASTKDFQDMSADHEQTQKFANNRHQNDFFFHTFYWFLAVNVLLYILVFVY